MRHDPAPIDPTALEEHAARLRALARGLVRDYESAEDVVQETCLRALTGTVRPRQGVGACLAGVARHVAWKLGRGEARRRRREAGAARPEATPSTADLLARLDERRRVLACVHALPEPYRSAILWRYFEGLPPREIARQLDVPVETVKTRLKRGLQRLREALDAEHGGDRRAWLRVLIPVAGFDLLRGASASMTGTLKTGGAVMGQTAGTKWTLGAAAAAVLLLGGWAASRMLVRDPEPAPDAPPGLLTAEGGAPTLGTRGPDARQAPADDGAARRPGPDADGAGVAPGAAGAGAPEAGAAGAATTPPASGETDLTGVPPAVRPSPFGLPKRKPGSQRMGGGWGGPTGHWTRFGGFPPPSGSATLVATVRDADGRPVPGADVYLGPPDAHGVDGISFGDLRKVGATGGDGRLEARALPAGGAAVFANWRNRLNGRSGLDGRGSVLTRLRPGATATVALGLPFSLGAVGALRGRVLGPEGTPLASASVAIGFQQQWTKADGAFAFEGVPEGEAQLAVRCTGYRSVSVPVVVAASAPVARDVTLDYAESGDARLEGRVVGPEGEPVPHANVYLMFTNERGTARSTRADAEGRFVLERLPDRARTESLRVQAGRIPLYPSQVETFPEGLSDERITIRIPMRYVQVELRVLDAATGEPVRMATATAERAASRQPRATLALDRGTGSRTGMTEAGIHTLVVEALDHEDLRKEIDVQPDADGRFVHTVRLARRSPDSSEVHLTVVVTDAASGAPVARVRVEVQDRETGTALSRFDGSREDGEVLMPAPSGARRVVVSSEGYETWAQDVELPAEPGVVTLEVALRAR